METTALPYSQDVLRHVGEQRTFEGASLCEIAFPLGGIGTGTISLGGRGNFRDIEIYNQPNKGCLIPFALFALWIQQEDAAPVSKILEGKIPPPFRGPNGELTNIMAGVPRFENVSFRGEYPTAYLTLEDPSIPVRAELKAWNPLIPLNVHDSAIPTAIYEWTLTNTTDKAVKVSLAANFSNPLKNPDAPHHLEGGGLNTVKQSGALRGVEFSHPEANKALPSSGTLALCTPHEATDVEPCWYRGGWYDKSHLFWDSFAATGKAPKFEAEGPAPHRGDTASLVLHATIQAGESVTLPVYLTWHFPHKENHWRVEDDSLPTVLDTYVSSHYEDAWAVAEYLHREMPRLREETARWQETVFTSTLPDHVLEAITSQASIMRTNTCFLLADGRFYGWEGMQPKSGSCHGSCTHVWNYEQAVAFLFPSLERSMRHTEFVHSTRETGNMAFRTNLPPGGHLWEVKPCADGQMGTVIQVYRDWKLGGGDEFLKTMWPGVKRAIEYAWTMTPDKMAARKPKPTFGGPAEIPYSFDSLWDPDKDGVMEGEQHNTYDIEFYGPNTMCSAMYLGALRAGEEIARHLGEKEKAEEYRAIFENGSDKLDELLWNGEYYVQKVNVIPDVTVHPELVTPSTEENPVPKYQYGEGCLSDQLLGQWAAHVAGLGYLLDRDKVAETVHSIFKYNFRQHLGDEAVVQRVYGLNDEPGLLLCSWPKGGRLALPFVYSDEVWTGIEYQVAAHLIYEGWINEGLTLVKAVSERYAGYNRNPWNQVECGYHYARAMSSWSVKLALDGFTFDATREELGFTPKLNVQNYRTFWSTGSGWGEYRQDLQHNQFTLEVLYGEQKIARLRLGHLPDGSFTVNGPQGEVAAEREGTTVVLDEPVTLAVGESLTVTVS